MSQQRDENVCIITDIFSTKNNEYPCIINRYFLKPTDSILFDNATNVQHLISQ